MQALVPTQTYYLTDSDGNQVMQVPPGMIAQVQQMMSGNAGNGIANLGDGIDIGAGDDSLGRYQQMFPAMRSCRAWDLADGDAQFLAGVPDRAFDFIHSSHCLEHLVNPVQAMQNWLRVLKPGGHAVLMVPDDHTRIFASTEDINHYLLKSPLTNKLLHI